MNAFTFILAWTWVFIKLLVASTLLCLPPIGWAVLGTYIWYKISKLSQPKFTAEEIEIVRARFPEIADAMTEEG